MLIIGLIIGVLVLICSLGNIVAVLSAGGTAAVFYYLCTPALGFEWQEPYVLTILSFGVDFLLAA